MIIQGGGKQGDLRVLKIEANDKDISQAVTQVIINQSIFNPFWDAQLLINDTTNLKTLVPLSNGCKFTITVMTSTGSKFDGKMIYNFILQSIENSNQINHMHSTYAINLVDEVVFFNESNLVSKAFEHVRSDKAVSDIVSQYLQYNIDTDSSDNSLTAIIPNIKPFEAINWIAKSSVSNGASDFIFYQVANKRMAFKSLSKLFDKEPNSNRKLEFNRLPTNDELVKNTNYDYNMNMLQISLTYPDSLFDVTNGYYGSSVYHFDLTKKRHSVIPYDGTKDSNFDIRDKYYNIFQSATNTVIKPIYTIDSPANTGMSVSEEFNKWVGSRRVNTVLPLRNILLTQTTGSSMYGSMLGEVVNVKLPSQQDFEKERDDKLYSGKYIISKISQRMNGTNYVVNFELLKLEIKADNK